MNYIQGIGLGIFTGYIVSSGFFFILQRKLRAENKELQSKNDLLMIIARMYDLAVTEAQKQYNLKGGENT